MTKKHKTWALAAALMPVLALGLWLPFGARRGQGSVPALPADPALRQDIEALIAEDANLLNRLLPEQELLCAARQGCAAALDYGEGQLLPVGGCAQPVQVERIVLLFSGTQDCAAVYADGQQRVFALDEALARRCRLALGGA